MAYVPPIGIPNPKTTTIGGHVPWGIDIDDPTPSWPASWNTGTTSATPGYYFIDSRTGNDSGNTYGHPQAPRATAPPVPYAAGSFIYFGGGDYTSAQLGGGDRWKPHGIGTSGSPIWIVGNPEDRPQIHALTHIGGYGQASFLIFRELKWSPSGATQSYIDIRPSLPGSRADHIMIQDCELVGSPIFSQQSLIQVDGGVEIEYNAADPDTTYVIESVVVQNCLIHDAGVGPMENSEQIGVASGTRQRFLWVLDCTIYGIGGDSLAGGHTCNATSRKGEYVFSGNCTLHDPNPVSRDILSVSDAGSGKSDFVLSSVAGLNFPTVKATATGTYSGGVLQSVTITNPGSGYTPGYVWVRPATYNTNDPPQIWAEVNPGTGAITNINVVYGSSGASGAMEIYSMCDVAEVTEDAYRGFWEVHEAVTGNTIRLTLPYAGNATGKVEFGHWNGENSFDKKSSSKVVVSQCSIKGPYCRENGAGIVLHSGANPVPMKDTWMIFNHIRHVQSGVTCTGGSTGTESISCIGNVIHDIRYEYSARDGRETFYGGDGIGMRTVTGNANYVCHNTIVDYEDGIKMVSGAGTAQVSNNIVVSRNDPTGLDLSAFSGVTLSRNLYYNGSPRWDYGAVVHTSLGAWQTASGETLSLLADPLLATDYQLQIGSPAIAAGNESPAYAAYQAMFGVDIRVDYAGGTRPYPGGGSWDIGAYEYGATEPPPPPGGNTVKRRMIPYRG